MNIVLQIFLLALLILQLGLIIHTMRRKKMSMKYGSMWIFLLFLMAIVVIFPGLVMKISNLFGFEATSNMVFLLGFFFLFYLIFILTAGISMMNEKIKLLIQEVSMLKGSVSQDGKKD